jgi:hypothetical protein
MDTSNLIEKLNQNTGVILINIFIILAVVFMLWNYYYIKNLESKECKKINSLYPEMNGKISSIKKLNVDDNAPTNYTHNLRDYYIKTAYNACSSGDYQNNVVSTCVLRDLLKQGVRGFDFEIYSLNNEPVVATSIGKNYYVKETFNSVPFGEVLNIFKNFSYSTSGSPNPGDPIIIHLRMQTENQEVYTYMAKLFESMNSYLLGKKYSYENGGKNLGEVPLFELRNKMIIIVDKSNPSFMENKKFKEYVNMTSNSVFMRALSYTNSVKFTPDTSELKTYNKQNMTIVLPDPTNDPENPSGLLCRSLGCQMVAMRYQNNDASLKESIDYYNKYGHAFVLKPLDLRYIPVYIDKPPPPNPDFSYAPRKIEDPTGLYKFNI